MFKLLRFYAIASFVFIFMLTALLTLSYRQASIHWISRLAESGNIAIAQTALNALEPGLADYLATTQQGGKGAELPAALAARLENIMPAASAPGFTLYDHQGRVALSSRAGQAEASWRDNPEFRSALGGKAASRLNYHDTFNLFGKAALSENILRTSVPVRNSAGQDIVGVLEIQTDVNELVGENTRMLVAIFVGAETLIGVLYVTLVFVVRRARIVIEKQQQSILDRTVALETLSRRQMRREELKKKKIATDLHEGLAQTLSAIKANIESTQSVEAIVPVIQSAIQEIRSIAQELRPSSLDDLGLIPTINWYCREFTRLHPDIQIEPEIELPEEEIPATLRIVIFRIIEMTFENFAQHSQTDRIGLVLQLDEGAVILEISDTPTQPSAQRNQAPEPPLRFTEMRERTILSYGTFSVLRDRAGGVTLRASWPGQTQGSAEQV